MEIQNPQTGAFFPVSGCFNFTLVLSQAGTLAFGVDWTKGGDGQELLRDNIGSGSLLKVRWRTKVYQAIFKTERDKYSNSGRVTLELRP